MFPLKLIQSLPEHFIWYVGNNMNEEGRGRKKERRITKIMLA